MSKANCSPELKALGDALRKHRRKVDLTQEELAADMPCISYGVYQKVEWGGREAGKKILPLMLKYFQSINDSEMVLALLEYAGANIAALHQQIESAAWRNPEDGLPPSNLGVSVCWVACRDGSLAAPSLEIRRASYIPDYGWHIAKNKSREWLVEAWTICEPPDYKGTRFKGAKNE